MFINNDLIETAWGEFYHVLHIETENLRQKFEGKQPAPIQQPAPCKQEKRENQAVEVVQLVIF